MNPKLSDQEKARLYDEMQSSGKGKGETSTLEEMRAHTPKKSSWAVYIVVPIVVGLFGLLVYNTPKPEPKGPPTRQDIVRNQFSGWNGSHPGLTRLIKAAMNDPDTYEHIETRYRDEGTKIFVVTKFRGANAFGGKVINTVSAYVDTNGNVLEIIDQGE